MGSPRSSEAESEGGAESGGGWLNVESTVSRHHGGLIFNSRDVTERVRLQAQLQHNAEHDPLTDLPNRALFTRRVQQALSGRRASDRGPALRGTAVLFIDLDGFKAVNDTIGHQAGTSCSSRPPAGCRTPSDRATPPPGSAGTSSPPSSPATAPASTPRGSAT